MKAASYDHHGGPEVLTLTSVADPVPGPGEVVVDVAATGVNRLDLLQRQGPGMLPGYELPHIAGMDLAGTISAVGPDVDGARIGERVVVNPAISCGACAACLAGEDGLCAAPVVIGGSRAGGYAERCAVPATHALVIPDAVELAEAASWPTAYSTAWHALFETGQLSMGETVLVHAASSGVTSAAIQLASRAGATVFVTARREDKLDHARKLGAAAAIDSRAGDVATAVRELTDGRGVDMVFDHVGPALFEPSLRSLRPRGRLVFCGTTTGARVDLHLPTAYRSGLRLLGAENYTRAEFERMIAYLASAELTSIVDRELPLADAAEAHRLLDSGEVLGKLLLRP